MATVRVACVTAVVSTADHALDISARWYCDLIICYRHPIHIDGDFFVSISG